MKRTLFSLLVALVLIMNAPCIPAARAEGAEPVTIVCSFYPVRILAENVLDGVPGVRLETLAPAGTGCLHDFQLMTGDLVKLDGALCLILNGAGMEQAFLPLLTREKSGLPLIDCAADIPLMELDGEDNPHLWLSPFLFAQMARNLGDALSPLLPDHADRILANAGAYAERLTALGEEMKEALSQCPGKNIVTFHEAFPYFARDLGLQVLASVTVEPDETPSPRLIAQTVDAIREAGICPLFGEPGVESDALNTIARETGAPVFTLNPITDGENVPTAYEDAMRENLKVLQEALK